MDDSEDLESASLIQQIRQRTPARVLVDRAGATYRTSTQLELTGSRGWKAGQPFVVGYCRVGVMNEIGELLRPKVVVLLIGERPGLATAESLSGYMAFQPRTGHSDANRNLISNIHARGVSI